MDEKIIDDWTDTLNKFAIKHNLTMSQLLYFFNIGIVVSMCELGFNEKEGINYLKMMELNFLAHLKEAKNDNT